jgi:UDP-sugar transporter A1/2/3
MQYILMGKLLSDIQWSSLVLIFLGATIASPDTDFSDVGHANGLIGMLVTVFMCSISISANIFNEVAFKRLNPKASALYKSAFICGYGALIYIVQLGWKYGGLFNLFNGWTGMTWVLLVNQSCAGIFIALIMQYMDAIVYVVIITASMLITSLISSIEFGFEITPNFICAV